MGRSQDSIPACTAVPAASKSQYSTDVVAHSATQCICALVRLGASHSAMRARAYFSAGQCWCSKALLTACDMRSKMKAPRRTRRAVLQSAVAAQAQLAIRVLCTTQATIGQPV